MTTWFKVLSRERLVPGAPVVVAVHGDLVTLVDLGDLIVAVDSACLRCGDAIEAPTGGDGAATCPGCGWRYDLRAGRLVNLPALWMHRYPVRVSGGDVYLGYAPADDPPRPGPPPRDLS